MKLTLDSICQLSNALVIDRDEVSTAFEIRIWQVLNLRLRRDTV